MGKWIITDGVNPGEGRPVGFVQTLSTGMIFFEVNGYLPVESAEFARAQLMAAINEVRGHNGQQS